MERGATYRCAPTHPKLRLAIALCSALLPTAPAYALEPTQATDGVYYGPMPASAGDWRDLAERGIATVVGVDGLPPDQAAADRQGLRVIHIPLGYDGVGEDDALQLAAVARHAEQPLYVFCHHGRHRSPTAAAIVCRVAGLLDTEGALDLLRDAGTSHEYGGLWRDVARFQPPPADADLPTLVAHAEASPLALAMTQLDRGWDAYQNADDESSRTEALVTIREALRESRRAARLGEADWDLRERLDIASTLGEQLTSGAVASRVEKPFGKTCVECHRRHRD